MNEQNKLLKAIQIHSFAVNEAVLYLDTHPHCRRALRFYETHRRHYLEAVALYEQKFGPLTIYGNECVESWKWAEQPWPWENC